MTSRNTLTELTRTALVAALYAVLTLSLFMFSYGAIQLRLSETLNNLAVFNKRYVVALTIGCAIANLWSPMGIWDVIFGSMGTLVMTGLSYYFSRFVTKTWHKLAISVVICTLSTWSVALELNLISHAPFWPTYLTVAIGEFISMIIGAILFGLLSRRIDLTN